MRTASTNFINKLNSVKRHFKVFATINLAVGSNQQGTVLNLDNTDIMQDGVKLEQSTSETNKFTVGSFILDKLTLTLYNEDGRYNDPIFTDADVDLWVSVESVSKTNGVHIGKFIVTDVKGRNTSLLELTCMDYGVKLNKVYVPTIFSGIDSTATAYQIISDCCTRCGVTLGTIPNSSYFTSLSLKNPANGEITCGQIISALAQMNCQYVKMNANGQLTFNWYHTSKDADVNDIFGFILGSEQLHYTGTKIIATGLKRSTEPSTSGQINQETSTYTSLSGDTGYVCTIENNPIIDLKVKSANDNTTSQTTTDDFASHIHGILGSTNFTPITLTALWNPLIEVGDTISTVIRVGGSPRTVTTMINNVTWVVGGQATYSCEAEIPSRNVTQNMSASSKVERQLKKMLQERVDDFNNAYQNMLSDIAHATGFHVTRITHAADGSIIDYYHNGNPDVDKNPDGSIVYNTYTYTEGGNTYTRTEPSFSTSTFLLKHAGTVIAASTDNGRTWNWAINVDGNFIAQQIATHKLIADDALIGNLTIRQHSPEYCSDNNISYNSDSANPALAKFTIPYKDSQGEHPGSVELHSDKIAITSSLSNEQTKTLQEAFEETSKVWFGCEPPTASNYPASGWADSSDATMDTAIKDYHVGDVYIDMKSGKQYRYDKLIGCQEYYFSNNSELLDGDYVALYYKYNNKYYHYGTFGGCGNHNDIAGKRVYFPSREIYIYFYTSSVVKRYPDDTPIYGVELVHGSSSAVYRSLNDKEVSSLPSASTVVTVSPGAWSHTRNGSYASYCQYIGITSYAFKRLIGMISYQYVANTDLRCDISTHSLSDFNSLTGSQYAWAEIENYELNTPAKILEKLTNGFTMEGLYMQNGKLYINMSYLRSGAISIVDSTVSPAREIFYAGYDNSLQKNTVRIKADSFEISAGSGYSTLADFVTNGYFNQAALINAINNNTLGQGLYADPNSGHVYISFDYAKGGTLTLGGTISNNSSGTTDDAWTYSRGKLRILSENNNLIGFWAGAQIKQYREITNSTYKWLETSRDYGATRTTLMDSSNKNHYIYEMHNIISFKNDSRHTVDTGYPYFNSDYEYWSVFEQYQNGFRFRAKKVQFFHSSLSLINSSYNSDGFKGYVPVFEIDGENGNGKVNFNSGAYFMDAVYLYAASASTNGTTLVLSDNRIYTNSSSSIRYKEIQNELVASDVEKYYNIKVYNARYKDGYLRKDDPRYGKYFPMFIAENVHEYFPDAVDLNGDGLIETWNERIMIPAMFQMIKSQKDEITELKNTVASLEDILRKLENLLLKES